MSKPNWIPKKGQIWDNVKTKEEVVIDTITEDEDGFLWVHFTKSTGEPGSMKQMHFIVQYDKDSTIEW